MKNLLSFHHRSSPKKSQPKIEKKWKGKIQNFAKALLGPITLLTAGGLFLGIGSIVEGQTIINTPGWLIGHLIQTIGSVVFNLLPLLFALAIAASLTNNNGTAIFSAVVIYYAIIMFAGAQFVPMANNQGWSWFNVIDFPNGSSEAQAGSIIESVLGVQTIQLNVFGGFIAGPIAAYCYRKFHDIRMPIAFKLFQGIRFVPIAGLFIALPVSLILALTWPWLAYGFIWFGEATNQLPAGLDSFLYGAIERILLPSGLHHMFYSPLLYTSAGALLAGNYTIANTVAIDGVYFGPGTMLWALDASPFSEGNINDMMSNIKGIQPVDFQQALADGIVKGDGSKNNPYLIINQQAFNNLFSQVSELKSLAGDRIVFQKLIGSQIQFAWVNNLQDNHSNYISRFVVGKVPSYLFFNIAGCLAMYLAAPKQNRKVVLGIVFPAALTCALTGITEPYEYTYLFVAPFLYFGFQAIMTGLSFMICQLMGIYFGGNDGGIIDLVIYGIIPHSVGQSTNWYYFIVIGLIGGLIYFGVFYFSIKKWDLKTPGRSLEKINNEKITTVLKSRNKDHDPLFLKAKIMYEALGGFDNLSAYTNCASRLRVTLKNPDLVNYQLIQDAKPLGIVGKNQKAQQFIFGNDVVIIGQKFTEIIEQNKKNKEKKET